MAVFHGFERGMGIGGWLTNYKRFHILPNHKRMCLTVGDLEHFQSYITEADVQYIASLGMDHIRLGFDQIVFEESPYVYREQMFSVLDQFLLWCEGCGLNVVLNLHKAVGNYCDVEEPVALLDDEELQNRFIALWVEFEKRYADRDNVAFELLNEVRNVPAEQWNRLAERAVTTLRRLNKTRKLILGSTHWNSPDTLKDLRLFDDENVIYAFHFYTPQEFTHQQGVLREAELFYNRKTPYPGDIQYYRDYACLTWGDPSPYDKYDVMDISYLRDAMAGAITFARQHPDRILWCGEFGTIRHANIKWRENWMRDVITILKENGISYCVWNYLSTPNDGNRFSLVDDDNRKILSRELAEIIRGDI